jgi:predicted DCC family thiol-disulfide oxidoreductase YuxK
MHRRLESTMTGSAFLIYDGDCGFCTRCVHVAGRLGCTATMQPWQLIDLATFDVTQQRAQREVLWIGPDSAVAGGADAIGQALRTCRGGLPLLGWMIGLPILRVIASIGYRAVARNRYRMPGGSAACAVRRS